MGSLQIVSTPIGNLGDITYRAVEALKSADVILAEDTRRTSILLRHYAIATRPVSAHAHNEAARAENVVDWLADGKNIALVSDAGTPVLSDPGARIIQRAIEAGFPVIPVPGPSAALAALVGAGLPSERFTFWGFLPRKRSLRDATLREIGDSPHTSILYESPRRVARLLDDLAATAGGERPAAVARELTKIHEEFTRGTLEELAEQYRTRTARGEIVVVVAARDLAHASAEVDPEEAARSLAASLRASEMSTRDVATELQDRFGLARNLAYRIAQEIADTER